MVEEDADKDRDGDSEKADSIPSIVRRPGAVDVDAADDVLLLTLAPARTPRLLPRHGATRRRLRLSLPPELGVVPLVSRLHTLPPPLLATMSDDPSSESRKSPRVSAPRAST